MFRALPTIYVVVLAVIAAAPAAASDPHASPKTATTAAGHKAGGEHAKPAAHAPTDSAKPGAPSHPAMAGKAALTKAATAAELEALSDRIQARLAEVTKAQQAAKAAAAPAVRRRSEPPAPRVRVVWRASVAWPAELYASDRAASSSSAADERVSLSWSAKVN